MLSSRTGTATKSSKLRAATTQRRSIASRSRAVRSRFSALGSTQARVRSQTRSFRSAMEIDSDHDLTVNFRYSPKRTATVFGVPLAIGQGLEGVDRAPAEMRKAGLIERITQEKWSISDDFDLPVNVSRDHKLDQGPNAKYKMRESSAVSLACEAAAKVTKKSTQDGHFTVSLGGDHSIALGTLAGVLAARPETGVIWVDAHADLNTPFTSGSGNIHGMPVAFLMQLPGTLDAFPDFGWLQSFPKLPTSNIVYIGLRDLDIGEKKAIRRLGIKAFSMQDVDRHGIAAVMTETIKHLTNDGRAPRPLHLSFDIDALDPIFAPSTGTRVNGGLTNREGYYICESLAETGLLASMDMVEVNPGLGEAESATQTVAIANGLVSAAMGNRIL